MFPRRALVGFAAALFVCASPGLAHPPSAEDEAQTMRAEARSIVLTVEGLRAHVRTALQRARERRVEAEIACADPLLTRVDVALRAARAAADGVAIAWGQGNAPLARSLMARVRARRDAAREAALVADACVDAPATRPGGTETVVRVVAPSLPDATSFPR